MGGSPGAGALGAGIYGTANRLLIPLGLHHILNSLVWFVFGLLQGPRKRASWRTVTCPVSSHTIQAPGS